MTPLDVKTARAEARRTPRRFQGKARRADPPLKGVRGAAPAGPFFGGLSGTPRRGRAEQVGTGR
jgi:hypothetical protein